MIWLYRLLFLPALIIAIPYYGLRMWRRGGYGKDFSHRFGALPKLLPPAKGKKRIWVQAVSVGEVLAVGPLLKSLQSDDCIEVILTATTSTGYTEARKRYQNNTLALGIFPADFWLFSRRAWNRLKPDAIILTESELWPEHMHQAALNDAPIFLVNARISNRSFERYQKFHWFAHRLLNSIDLIFAASELDRKRLISLGTTPKVISSTGNIKFDVAIGEKLTVTEQNQLKKELGFTPKNSGQEPFILVGASTWPGEEALLLEIQKDLIQAGNDCRLLIVPRHAERAPEVRKEFENWPINWHQRSKSTDLPDQNPIDTYLADTTGELARLIQVADLVFIGKSLPPNEGGQTPIEAAGLGLPFLMGPNMQNFQSIAASLIDCGAAKQVSDAESLKKEILKLLHAPEERLKMAECGETWHRSNKGTTNRICESIRKFLFENENHKQS